MQSKRAQSRGDETRESLISAATEVFARDGFHAASTRAIAETAGCNQALIAYHFGGKEGLYLAVFESMTNRVAANMQPVVDDMEARIADLDHDSAADRAAALALLESMIGSLIGVFLDLSTPAMVKLIMREQQDPTEAFDIFYGSVYSRTLGLLGRLVALAGGSEESPESRIQALTLFGQILIFFIGRATASRVMGWKQVGKKELEMVRQQVLLNLQAQYKKGEPV